MKKITLEINSAVDENGAKEISEALNDLSGIVASDVILADSRAYAYAGDQIEVYSVSNAVRNKGYSCHVVNEEYLSDVEDYKKSLGIGPFAAPVDTIL